MLDPLILLLSVSAVNCSNLTQLQRDLIGSRAFSLFSFITPAKGKYDVSEQCLDAGQEYLAGIGKIF